MATENIVIVVTENGARVVQRSLSDIGSAATSSAGGVDLLKIALEGLAGAFAIKELTEAMDSYANLQNRLIAVGASATDLGMVYEKLRAVSLETHSALDVTINLYSRLELGLKSLGYSQTEAINFTRQLSEAVKLSGASSQEAKYAIQDLAHGIAAGTINGRELNGILREMPSLAQLIAQALGKQVGELKHLATEGKITADALIQGFARMDGQIRDAFGRRITTIKDALTDLKTNFVDWVGKMATSLNTLNSVSSAIEYIAHHMREAMTYVVMLGAALFVFIGLPMILSAIGTALWVITAALLANPFLAIAAGIAAVVVWLELMGDTVNAGIDGVTTYKDVWRAFVQLTGENIRWLGTMFIGVLNSISSGWGDMVGGMTLYDWLQRITKVLDVMVVEFLFVLDTLRLGFRIVFLAFPELVMDVVNSILRAIGGMVNTIMSMLGRLYTLAGKKLPTPIDLTFNNPLKGATDAMVLEAQGAGVRVSKALAKALAGDGAITQALTQKLVPLAQQLARDRIANAPKDGSDLDAHGPRTPPVVENKGVDKLQKALEEIENKWDHISKLVNEYNHAVTIIGQAEAAGKISKQYGDQLLALIKDEEIDKVLGKYNPARKAANDLKTELRDLNSAVAAGIITQAQANSAQEVAILRAKEHVDPLKHLTDEMDREMKLMKASTYERSIANEIHKDEQSLLQKGIILHGQEKDAFEARVRAQHEANLVGNEYTRVLDSIEGPQQRLQAGIKALNQLMAEGKITSGQYGQELLKLKTEADAAGTGIANGFRQGLDKFGKDANDLAGQTSNMVNKTLNGMNDAIIKFAETGKLNFADLAKSVFEDISKMILKWLEWQAIQALLGPMGGGMMGMATGGDITVGSNLPHFDSGGGMRVGGSGGTDSQVVAFRASPNETISVRRPDQMPGGGRLSAQQGGEMQAPPQVHVPIKIINSMDPQTTLDHMSSSEGERVILNTLQRNPQAVRSIVGR